MLYICNYVLFIVSTGVELEGYIFMATKSIEILAISTKILGF